MTSTLGGGWSGRRHAVPPAAAAAGAAGTPEGVGHAGRRGARARRAQEHKGVRGDVGDVGGADRPRCGNQRSVIIIIFIITWGNTRHRAWLHGRVAGA
ncbi:hypothetical protein EYF80_016806 [Liparis tanakae]|uniref:Uncharacterized protein n=1 Tax=Liparis tanakae TaxID=230148 RepID=A0A4Z2I4F0_9TELE|nr:hypothetical protein EYF80_016806 [Liparis tanakae]